MKKAILFLTVFLSLSVQAYEASRHVINIKNPLQTRGALTGLPKDICISALCPRIKEDHSIQNILNSIKKNNGISSLDYTGPCTPGKGCRPRQVCPRDPKEPCPPPDCEPDPQCN